MRRLHPAPMRYTRCLLPHRRRRRRGESTSHQRRRASASASAGSSGNQQRRRRASAISISGQQRASATASAGVGNQHQRAAAGVGNGVGGRRQSASAGSSGKQHQRRRAWVATAAWVAALINGRFRRTANGQFGAGARRAKKSAEQSVGLGRFELPTFGPPDRRANQAAPQPVATRLANSADTAAALRQQQSRLAAS